MANDDAPRRSGPVGASAAPDDATVDLRRPRAAATTGAVATTATAAAAATTATAPTAPAAVDHTLTSPHPDPRGVAFGAGDRIHRYQLTSLLGIGGMGVVYAADDVELHRPVAIKLLHQGGGADAAERALREARAMAQFRHANVVPLFDVGVHHGHVYLVMPLLEEGTLGGWLRAARRPWRAIVRKFALAARGLEAAHAAGLVHRDFKPENVLLGADDEVRVADFGLVSADDDLHQSDRRIEGGFAATQTRLRGTPAYMAPEQLDGADVDARADQFAFCVALHAALYGQRPFAEADADPLNLGALREAIQSGRIRPPPPDRRVPRWLAAAIARGLRDDPTDRWPSMAALVAALDRGLARTRWGLLGLGVGLAALAGIAVAVALGATARRADPSSALTRDISDTDDVAAITTRAGRETSLTRRGQINVASLSPDGSKLAVYSRGELLVMPSTGGVPRVLHKDLPDALGQCLSWSFDSKRIHTLRVHPSFAPMVGNLSTDVESGSSSEATLFGGWATQLANGEIVTATYPAKRLFFKSFFPLPRMRACELPGTYDWITDLRVSGSTIYVHVVYPGGQGVWLATDQNCATPRAACPGDAIPLPGERCMFLWSNSFGATWRSNDRFLIETERVGRIIGAPRRVDPDATRIVGVKPDGAVVLLKASETWRITDYTRATQREFAAGADLYPQLALAPDGRQLAMTERTHAGAGPTRLTRVAAFDDRSPAIASHLSGFAWSPNGKTLAAHNDTRLVLIDVASMTRREIEITIADLAFQTHLTWLDDHRVAFLRPDHRAYRWINVNDETTGDVLEAKGYTFGLTKSSFSGNLALWWNRDRPGVWIVSPNGRETLAIPTQDYRHLHAWSVDGRTLWLANPTEIFTFDPRSRRRKTFQTINLPLTTELVALLPIADDRVLLETRDSASDLVHVDP